MIDAVASGPLTWAQRFIWLIYQDLPPERRHEMANWRAVQVPSDVDLAAIRAAVTCLMDRHEALRTTYRIEEESGEPVQVVHRSGAARWILLEGGSDDGFNELVGQVTACNVDIEREQPLVVGVLMNSGRPQSVLLNASHVALDGASVTELANQLAALLQRSSAGLESGPADWQPLAEVARETSEAGRRQNERALGYWRKQLSVIPAAMVAQWRIEAIGPRYAEGRLSSAVLLSQLRRVAAERHTSPAIVCLATFMAMLSHVTGQSRPALLLMAANRFGGHRAHAVGSLALPAVMSVEVDPQSRFSRLISDVAIAWMSAVRHARYAFDEFKELSANVAADRRITGFRTATTFNYRSFELDDEYLNAQQTVPPGAEYHLSVKSATRSGTGTDVYLWVLPGTVEVTLEIAAHQAIMTPAAAGAFLTGIHRSVCCAARRDLTVTEVMQLADMPVEPTASTVDPKSTSRHPMGNADPAALRALQSAIGRYHPGRSFAPDSAFIQQGGRMLRAPAVRNELNRLGYGGLASEDFAGLRSLTELAAQLRPIQAGALT